MLNVKLPVAALVAVLVAGLLAVPNAGAQSSGRQCIPEAGRPAVSAVRGGGDVNAGTSPIGFTVQVRHHGNTVSAVTVSVTVNRDGVTSSETVVVPTVSNPQMLSNRDFVTRATLSVSRTSTTQTVAITVNENANYYVCKVHAGVSITGVHRPAGVVDIDHDVLVKVVGLDLRADLAARDCFAEVGDFVVGLAEGPGGVLACVSMRSG